MKRRRGVISVREVGAWRRYAVLLVLLLGSSVVLARAYELQVIERDFLAQQGNKRTQRTVTVPANRGAIRDRNGDALALSAPVESVWGIPAEILEAPEYLPALARLLHYSERELKSFLKDRATRHFVYLRRHLNPEDARHILAVGAPGVFGQREYRRYYPAGEVAGHVVGFCDIDGRGQEGMESAEDGSLRGQSGLRRVLRDRTGRVVEERGDYQEAQPGGDLTLTLDLRLQYLAYRELKGAVSRHNARGGTMVIVDVTNGDILAMVSQPGYNPNKPEDRDSKGLRNRAATDLLEPGSTIKPLLVAQALELGAFNVASVIDTTPGLFKLGALTVRDSHPVGKVNLMRLLSQSSNVGAARIGLALGAEKVWLGLQRFGLGEPVYSGYPGEATGVLRPYNQWGDIGTATASFGYGLSVNPLQLARAYSALANDGLLPNLRLVARPNSSPPQRVLSADTARQVRLMLEDVTRGDGTGRRAAVPGFRVAGKTGTVRKPAPGGYATDKHQGVFIGFLPATKPRLLGLVVIDEPRNDKYYGGEIAAPVFSRVMRSAARLLSLPQDEAVDAEIVAVRADEPVT